MSERHAPMPPYREGGVNKIAIIVAGLALIGCEQAHSPPDRSSPAQAPAPAEPARPRLPDVDRAKLISTATRDLIKKRDKVEKISFYSPKNQDGAHTNLRAYLSVPDDGPVFLRMMPLYYGDHWIFFTSLKVMADDEIVYEKNFDLNQVHRDNADEDVWEYIDYAAGGSELLALRKIVSSKEATIRFNGDQYRQDHEITRRERDRLKQILSAYESLSHASVEVWP
jgi:hypothetical protein